jgi:hypothetical protein
MAGERLCKQALNAEPGHYDGRKVFLRGDEVTFHNVATRFDDMTATGGLGKD